MICIFHHIIVEHVSAPALAIFRLHISDIAEVVVTNDPDIFNISQGEPCDRPVILLAYHDVLIVLEPSLHCTVKVDVFTKLEAVIDDLYKLPEHIYKLVIIFQCCGS